MINDEAKAYPLNALTAQSPVLLDSVGDEAIMLVLGPDGKSVRLFSRKVDSSTLDFYRSNLVTLAIPGRCSMKILSANGASTALPQSWTVIGLAWTRMQKRVRISVALISQIREKRPERAWSRGTPA